LGGEIYEALSWRSFQEGEKKKKTLPSGGWRSVLLVMTEILSCQSAQRRVSALRGVAETLGRCPLLLTVTLCHIPGKARGLSSLVGKNLLQALVTCLGRRAADVADGALARGSALTGTTPGLPKAQSSQESIYRTSCLPHGALCPALKGLPGSNPS